MDIFTELRHEFGSLYRLAMLLEIRETAIYQWKARCKGIPLKHLRKIVDLSQGRLTREMLRPDIFGEWYALLQI